MAEFEWPCPKRTAHGPHPRELIGWAGGFDGVAREFLNDPKGGPTTQHPDPVYLMGNRQVTNVETCPGVKAHPNTMIGRP